MARIVLNPFGSFGDLHPYMALALGLKQRGHHPVIATSGIYRSKVEEEGLEFAAVRPDVGDLVPRRDLIAKMWNPTDGTRFLLKEYLLPQVREAFEDLLPAAKGADLLVTHMAAFAGPVVADALGLPWLSVVLQPSAFFSRYDVLVVPEAPWLRHLYPLGSWFTNLMLHIGDSRTRRWAEPVHQLRKELGLPSRVNPIMHSQFSPVGSLALFSRHFARPQPDWPVNSYQAGFLFYDRSGTLGNETDWGSSTDESQLLDQFLASGPAPILFTLGSSAVMQADNFFDASREAAAKIGARAILLVGREVAERLSVDGNVVIAPYLPFSKVMSRVSLVVHQGGIGTTAQTLRAGRPSVVVPWSHDQPDNGDRLRRLGVGEVLARKRYAASTAVPLLKQVLADQQMQSQAVQIGKAITAERALESACDAVEHSLVSGSRGS